MRPGDRRPNGVTVALLLGLLAALWLSFALQPSPPVAPALKGGIAVHAQDPATHWRDWRAGLGEAAHAELAAAWRQATGLPLNRLGLWLVAGEALTYRPALAGRPWAMVARTGPIRGLLARRLLPGAHATPHGLALSPDPDFAGEVATAARVDTAHWAPLRLALAEPGGAPLAEPRMTLERFRDGRVALHLRVAGGGDTPWRAGPMDTGLWHDSAAALHASDGAALAATVDAVAGLLNAWMPAPDTGRLLPGVRLPAWPDPGMAAWRDAGTALAGMDSTDILPWPVLAASGALADPAAPPWADWVAELPQLPHRWGTVPGVIAPILGEHVALCAAQGPDRWYAASQEPALSGLLSAAALPGGTSGGVAWLRLDTARLAHAVAAAGPWFSDEAVQDLSRWSGLMASWGALELLAPEPPRESMLAFWSATDPEAVS
jgi:hypothetical protein